MVFELIALVSFVASLEPAAAHDIYPWYCCSGTDCGQAVNGEIVEVPGGWHVVPSGETFTYRDKIIHISPDRRFHRCLSITNDPSSPTVCIFVPENGS